MEVKKFREILEWLSEVTDGSVFDGNLFAVGGAVRDYIMGREIKDIDLVVANIPDGGIKFAEWMESKGNTVGSVVTYPTYGTAMFRSSEFPDVELECVQTRCEQYHDKNSRNPETHFGTMEEDAFRRDLTINSLYANVKDMRVLDPTGKGLDDIKNHVIRITNENPDVVLSDDPLRMLRVCRFSCRYGWGVDEKTFEAVARNAHRLCIISPERIQDELVKILLSPNPVMGLQFLKQTGLLVQFMPEFSETFELKQNVFHDYCTVWEHTVKVIANASKIETADVESKRLLMVAALLHDIGKPATFSEEDGKVHFYGHENKGAEIARATMKRLRFSNDDIDEVCFMVRNHMRFKWCGDAAPKDKVIRRFQYVCETPDRFRLAMQLIHADNVSHGVEHCLPSQFGLIMKRSDELVSEGESMFGYKLPVKGDDIMRAKGIGPGPDVKKFVERLTKVAFNGVKELDRETCLKLIKNT
jgi:putative nucleotidyltransferase with HDIG domain